MENSHQIHKKLLITGCGRSGTKYIAYLLRRLGMDVRHEHMGKEGIASWILAIDSDSVPWRQSPRDTFTYENVFHQVRHPLRVIPSLFTFKKESWEFICKHTPCSFEDTLLLRSAKYWYYWNLEAEKIAHWRYRVEDIADVFEEFCERLQLHPERAVLDRLPMDINTRKFGRPFHAYDEVCERLRIKPSSGLRRYLAKLFSRDQKSFSWEDLQSLDSLLCNKIKHKAEEYGYAS